MKRHLQKEKETLEKTIENGQKEKSYNLMDFDGSISLDELYEIRGIIEDRLSDYTGGSSIEGNGTNFNFTFNGKPFLLRVEKDDFHTEHWKENKLGFWSDKKEKYKNGLGVK
jgi:hypothetical protein